MKKRILIFLLCFFSIFTKCVFANDYTGHWAQNYLQNAIDEGFLSGVKEGKIEPDRFITRAEFVTLLVKYTNLDISSTFTSFTDIKQKSWYFDFISTAEENNIIKGFPDGTFKPDKALSREDAVVFLCRAYQLSPISDSDGLSFYDISDISDYAKSSVFFSVKKDILKGYPNNTIKPKNNITRAEAVVLLDNFKKASSSFEKTPQFVNGYPKISSTGSKNNITIDIKTTAPCNVYYLAIAQEEDIELFLPDKSSINNFLASCQKEKTLISSTIQLNSYSDTYTIYFIAVAENGATSNIEKIKNAKALAFSVGNGTASSPYVIYNEEDLNYIRYFSDNHFKLANDITLTKEWTPIEATSFGSLDGAGYKISNLSINSASDNVGFFSTISGGIIKNLHINGDITGKNNVGLFAGKTKNTVIKNCLATGFVKASNNAGGMVGSNGGSIKNSLSSLYSVESISNAGGIVGANSGEITSSMASVHSVLADMYAGGIAGINNSGYIQDSICANINVVDFFSYNSGRITTNKEDGTTKNNYAYTYMNTGSSAKVVGLDSVGGADVRWNDLLTLDFYKNSLGWNFKTDWKLSDSTIKNYILPIPRIFYDISLTKGITPYSPIKISSAKQLENLNPDLHYILIKHIDYNKEWKTPEKEFYGSLDGSCFSIRGIKFTSDSEKNRSFFGETFYGTLRNVIFEDVTVSSSDAAYSITKSNAGIIENCKIKGKISATKEKFSVLVGGFCINNYGIIDNCETLADLKVTGLSSSIGGICSNNEGYINNSAFKGKITYISTDPNSSISAGGISGINNNGFIYNSYTNTNFEISSFTNYIGGICGILDSGEIFKCSTNGKINSTPEGMTLATSYTGGISGLSVTGLIYNSFSSLNITSHANKNYSGGICGYNSGANIQNTYSINTISQYNGNSSSNDIISYAGGIAGYNEAGFICDNVALNPWIYSFGEAKKISTSKTSEFLNNNYAYADMIISSPSANDNQNGKTVKLTETKLADFFFKSIHSGGELGWSGTSNEGENGIWTYNKSEKNTYFLPILNGVKYQDEILLPSEFK